MLPTTPLEPDSVMTIHPVFEPELTKIIVCVGNKGKAKLIGTGTMIIWADSAEIAGMGLTKTSNDKMISRRKAFFEWSPVP